MQSHSYMQFYLLRNISLVMETEMLKAFSCSLSQKVEFATFSQLEPEYPMNKLQCFIIDREKRCRCDNSWQNGRAAN